MERAVALALEEHLSVIVCPAQAVCSRLKREFGGMNNRIQLLAMDTVRFEETRWKHLTEVGS